MAQRDPASSGASTLAGDEPAPQLPRLTDSPSSGPEKQPVTVTPPSEDATEEEAEKDQVRTVTGLRWILMISALYLTAFLYGLDTTIAADIQGAVIETFDNATQLAWLGAGFPMGSVAVILLVSSLFGSFNFKWIFVISVILFEAGSALCGAAPDMNALIVGRAFAGAGGSGIYLGALNYVSTLTTRKERGAYIAGIGLFWGLGAVLGPVVGGGFSESPATWRWAFYVNLPVGALAAPVILFYLPSIHPAEGVSVRSRVERLDFVGFVLNIGIWVSFAMAFTMAGTQWPWADGRSIATVVVFGALVVLYALQQHLCLFTTPETRSFPVHLLRSRTQLLLYVSASSNNAAIFVMVYFIPVYFQFVHGDGPVMAAVRLLPFIAVSVTFNLASGWLLAKIRLYMAIYLVSGVFILVGGSLLVAYLSASTSEGLIYGFTVIMAIGTGLTQQLSYTVSSLTVPARHMGDSISFMNVAQMGGTVISLVLAGQVFQSLAARNLAAALDGQGFSDAEVASAISGARSEMFERLGGHLRGAAIDAITRAMQRTFVLPVVGGAAIMVSSLLMKRERLFGKAAVA